MTTRRLVTVTWPLFDEASPEAATLREAGADLRFASARGEDDLIAACQGAWASYGGAPFTRRVLEALPDLRYIQCLSVGFDYIDAVAATEHNVAVANNPMFCREEVADVASMFILAAARRLPKQLHRLQQGWDTRAGYAAMGPTPRVKGSTLGFIAFGAIARLTAEKLRGFGMRYLAYDPYLDPAVIRQHGAEPVSLEELCRQSDVLSMHALLNDETRGLLRAEHFRLMKPTAWVVNTSRGATIHEASLITALREGWIGGACLDVVEREPAPADNPLLAMPNVLVTAHTAGFSDDAMVDQRQQSVAELARVLKGEWPRALANPAVKEKGGIW
jgi:D-3-phosphoglycerate dehydrogenase